MSNWFRVVLVVTIIASAAAAQEKEAPAENRPVSSAEARKEVTKKAAYLLQSKGRHMSAAYCFRWYLGLFAGDGNAPVDVMAGLLESMRRIPMQNALFLAEYRQAFSTDGAAAFETGKLATVVRRGDDLPPFMSKSKRRVFLYIACLELDELGALKQMRAHAVSDLAQLDTMLQRMSDGERLVCALLMSECDEMGSVVRKGEEPLTQALRDEFLGRAPRDADADDVPAVFPNGGRSMKKGVLTVSSIQEDGFGSQISSVESAVPHIIAGQYAWNFSSDRRQAWLEPTPNGYLARDEMPVRRASADRLPPGVVGGQTPEETLQLVLDYLKEGRTKELVSELMWFPDSKTMLELHRSEGNDVKKESVEQLAEQERVQKQANTNRKREIIASLRDPRAVAHYTPLFEHLMKTPPTIEKLGSFKRAAFTIEGWGRQIYVYQLPSSRRWLIYWDSQYIENRQ